jgi:hypothetical protein
MNALYLQSEKEKLFSNTEPWNLSAAFEYLREDSVGDSLVGLSQTYLIGAKLGVDYENWTLSGIVTQIGDQTLLGSGNSYNQMGWSSFITFSDLQIDGESENAGALAYGGILKRKFDESFETSLKYMHINQDDAKQSDVNSLTHNSRPDSDEYNLDAIYKASKSFKIRTRFAYIDYDPSSTELYKDKAFDEFNTRIILDFLF